MNLQSIKLNEFEFCFILI